MCGIAGVLSFDERFQMSEKELSQGAEYLSYRGPDQEGYYIREAELPKAYLAHKRLSIIDLSEGGRQPMTSVSGNTVITFNGEIYNYRQLRDDLKNVAFRSQSDTEVILELYEKYGIEKTLELIDGMFAFCLLDQRNGKCYLARDRFGKKPLYYSTKGDSLYFSSDIRTIRHFRPDLTVDRESLVYFFQEMCTPEGASIWREVHKVRAGHCLEFNRSGVREEKYWDINYKTKHSLNAAELTDRIEALLQQAVAKRLVADVPVGCFLSGGVDSGLVTAMAAKSSASQIQTFSVGFDYEAYDELDHARKVAERYGTRHHEIRVNAKDLSIMDEILEEFGEPFADSSMIPAYYVSRFAQTEMKVVMGGDGGDELFAGYNTYLQGLRMQRLMRFKGLAPVLNLMGSLLPSGKLARLSELYRGEPSVVSRELYRNLGFSPAQLEEMLPGSREEISSVSNRNNMMIVQARTYAEGPFDELMYSSIKTRLVDDYLVKVDRASMFTSLEVRCPFLDKDLAEFTAGVSYSDLMQGGQPKFLLKKLAEKYLPKENIYKPKQGFAVPIGEWIRHDFKDHFYQTIFETQQDVIDIDYTYLKSMFAAHLEGTDHSHRLFTAYVFHKWIGENA